MPSLAMSRAERDAFLAAPRVAIVSIAEPGRGPLTVPVWYRYEPGGPIVFATGIHSRKARLIRAAGRIGFCVQSETVPYQYVSVEGPADLGEPDHERDIRQMTIRYLGEEMAALYLAQMAADLNAGANVLVTMTPERWYSVDYSKLG